MQTEYPTPGDEMFRMRGMMSEEEVIEEGMRAGIIHK